jgi:hypothetical protein
LQEGTLLIILFEREDEVIHKDTGNSLEESNYNYFLEVQGCGRKQNIFDLNHFLNNDVFVGVVKFFLFELLLNAVIKNDDYRIRCKEMTVIKYKCLEGLDLIILIQQVSEVARVSNHIKEKLT